MKLSEAELCELFKAAIKPLKWIVHSELDSWDMLVVGPGGLQIGVQAKLRANADVLLQTLGGTSKGGYNIETWPGSHRCGPDYRMILVPVCGQAVDRLARHLHVMVTTLDDLKQPAYFQARMKSLQAPNYFAWGNLRTCWVPPVHIDMPAGTPSPSGVSKWKVAAVQLCMRLRKHGYVTSRDFQDLKLAFSTFWRLRLRAWGRIKVPKSTGKGHVSLLKYVQSSIPQYNKLPDEMFPELAAALKELP